MNVFFEILETPLRVQLVTRKWWFQQFISSDIDLNHCICIMLAGCVYLLRMCSIIKLEDWMAQSNQHTASETFKMWAWTASISVYKDQAHFNILIQNLIKQDKQRAHNSGINSKSFKARIDWWPPSCYLSLLGSHEWGGGCPFSQKLLTNRCSPSQFMA